jgi:hypothetical protein
LPTLSRPSGILLPFKNFDVRLAYKYYDVQADYIGGRREVPFMAKHRGFVNLAYSTNKNDKGGFWSFDTTLNWVGKQRLPDIQQSCRISVTNLFQFLCCIECSDFKKFQ